MPFSLKFLLFGSVLVQFSFSSVQFAVQFAVLFWFSFGSVCSLVLDYFAGDAFVAGDIDHIDAGNAQKLNRRYKKRALTLGVL